MERSKILETNLNNDFKYDWSKLNNDETKYTTYKAENTIDKIFLLSIDEIVKYIDDDNKKLATKPTNYASKVKDNKGNTIRISNNKKEWYIGNADFALRSISKFFDKEYVNGVFVLDVVLSSGRIATGRAENHYYGIRPAMWVKYE